MGEICESHKLTMRQIAIHRRNLIDVCRLAVKSLIDKSCFETIDDGSDELVNFTAIIEQILCHRLKPRLSWYGTEDQRPFWEFIKIACKKVPHNCIANIESMENIHSGRAKGRAWLRMALMEKRLSEYISTALQQDKTIRSFYDEGAIMLSEEADMLSGLLLGLNTIDFNFCLKGENLELTAYPIIDYTPYLKYQQSPESLHSDACELETLSVPGQETSPDFPLDDGTWKSKYLALESRFRTLCQQKSYVEELARLREAQLHESERQKEKLVATFQHKYEEHKKDRQELESIIVELQNQLTIIKAQQEADCQNIEDYLTRHYLEAQNRKSGAAAFALRELRHSKSAEETSSSSFLEEFGRKNFSPNYPRMLSSQHPTLKTSRSENRDQFAEIERKIEPHQQFDTKSLTSTFSASLLEDSGSMKSNFSGSKGREDSLSMKPLAGSFSSQSSMLSNEAQSIKLDLSCEGPSAPSM